MQLFLTILAFNFIIIIHELGHFVVAKLAGIKVQEFSLFVGPKLLGFRKGETDYSIRLFPILAYVKMEGEDEAAVSDKSFNVKPLPVRAAVIAAGPLMNLLSAIVIFAVVFSYTGYESNKISQIGKDTPAYNIGIQPGDEIIRYDFKRAYNPFNVLEFLYVTKGQPTEIVYRRGDQTFTKEITPRIIPKNRYMLGFGPKESYGDNSNVVEVITKDSPSDKAGLMKNDRIVKMNGTAVRNMMDIIEYMSESKDKPIDLTVERNGSTVVLKNLVPVQGKNDEAYDLGLRFTIERGNIVDVVKQSAVFTYSTMRDVAYTISWLVQGKVSLSQMSGPVGIVTVMNDSVQVASTIQDKLISLLRITAFISVAVGATNLVPFPALDGGRLVVLLVEAIRRKPLPVEKEATVTMVGFVILIALAIFTTSNDLIKLFGRIFTGG